VEAVLRTSEGKGRGQYTRGHRRECTMARLQAQCAQDANDLDKWDEYNREVESIIAAQRERLLAAQRALRYADLGQDVKDVVERRLQIQQALGLSSNALDPQVAQLAVNRRASVQVRRAAAPLSTYKRTGPSARYPS